jgi:carboxylesterase
LNICPSSRAWPLAFNRRPRYPVDVTGSSHLPSPTSSLPSSALPPSALPPSALPPSALPAPSAARYERKVPGARAHALCVHGYTGSPYEVRVVADALAQIGVSSTSPLLPGHGTEPEALSRTSWRDWVRASDDEFAALPPGPRVLVGSSMGALLMLRLAASFPDRVSAVVLLAPALRYFADGAIAGRLARRGLWRLYPMMQKAESGGDLRDAEGQANNPCYPRLATRGIGELQALQREVEPMLPLVRAPLCVFHGAQDHTIPKEASAVIAERVSSLVVEHHVLRDSFHVLGLDVDRDVIAMHTCRFVAATLDREAA